MKKTTTVELTVKEIEEIVVAEMKRRGVIVKGDVYFNVSGFDREDDWRAEFDLEYQLTGVTFEAVDVPKGKYDGRPEHEQSRWEPK